MTCVFFLLVLVNIDFNENFERNLSNCDLEFVAQLIFHDNVLTSSTLIFFFFTILTFSRLENQCDSENFKTQRKKYKKKTKIIIVFNK